MADVARRCTFCPVRELVKPSPGGNDAGKKIFEEVAKVCPPPAINTADLKKKRHNSVVFLERSHLQEVYLSPLF